MNTFHDQTMTVNYYSDNVLVSVLIDEVIHHKCFILPSYNNSNRHWQVQDVGLKLGVGKQNG